MPKELHPYAVLRGPVLTEKSTELTELGKYVFEVDPRANKMQIKEAVEIAFSVAVKQVNVMVVKGKEQGYGRRKGTAPVRKKAVVTLAEGYAIKLFEGV
jgi:large subunit ribosomal protein L23